MGDLIADLDEEPLSEPVLRWLADELNKEQTLLLVNPPSVGSRGPKEAPIAIEWCAGFIAQGSAKFNIEGPDGAGVYAEVETLPQWTSLVGSIIESPFGIDITAFYQNSVVSLDVVVRSRGTGKVIAAIQEKPSRARHR